MKHRIVHLLVLVLLCVLYAGVFPVSAVTVKDYNVPITATVSETPPQIVLSWPAEPLATVYQLQRKLYDETTWSTLAILPGTATGWTDTTVTVGTLYEYQLARASTIPAALGPLNSYGCISAGIRIPVVDHRGTLILIVDNTMATPLASELIRLREDLIGDGWSVIRHDVSRTAAVTAIKSLIKAEYDAAPTEVKSVFLFGHIPVPQSGADAPGSHADVHLGAFPADTYYGEMDGLWTDTIVNNTTAQAPWTACWNVPGDGKFDQTRPPTGVVELEVGRVDLSNMSAFAPKTETDLLRQYLDKDHAHRHAQRVLPQRALISDEMGERGGNADAQGAWRAWSALVGRANISEGPFSTMQTESYLAYARFGGGDTQMCGTVFTADFATQQPQAAFFMLFGSHFCDWNYANNILRAPLCTTTGLTSVYSGFPHWLLHRMALGGTIGDSARVTQNNKFLNPPDDITPTYGFSIYLPQTSKAGGAHITLMGDPTLRMVAVTPPTTLTIIQNGDNNPVLSWAASADAALGYHIYRAVSAEGPFTRLTATPVTGTTWTDTSVTSGTLTYQVKAVRLEATPGGTYLNTSQALSRTATLGAQGGNEAPVAADQNRSVNEDTPLSITLTASDADNDPLSFAVTTNPGHGSLSGTAPNITYTPAANYHGLDSLTFNVTDGKSDPVVGTISILVNSVNDTPTTVMQNLLAYAGTPKSILLTGSDVDGDVLTFAVTGGPTHGTLTGTAPNLTYTATANYEGTDSFTYTVSDGTAAPVTGTVSLTVAIGSAIPIIFQADFNGTGTGTGGTTNLVTVGGTGSIIAGAGGTLSTPTDPPTMGDGGFLRNIVKSSGAVPQLNFTPAAPDNSWAAIFNRSSGKWLVNGGIDFFVRVGQTPTLSGAFVPFDFNNGTGGIRIKLANTSTTEMRLEIITTGVAGGLNCYFDYTLTSNVVHHLGIFFVTDASTGVTTAKIFGKQGTDSFTTVDQANLLATSTFNISETIVNTTGFLSGGSWGFYERLTTGGPKTNDYDCVRLYSSMPTCVPAIDGSLPNTPPTASNQSLTTDEETALGITLTGADVDGDALTYAVATQPSHGTLSGTAPNLTYTPTDNYSGADSFTFTVNDGEATATGTVTITVHNTNDAPTANIAAIATYASTPVTLTLTGADIDGDALTVVLGDDLTTGAGTLSAGLAGHQVTYTPAAGFLGMATFTFRMQDPTGALSDPATVTLTVTPLPTYTVTTTSGAGGTVKPAGTRTVTHGGYIFFSALPAPNYGVDTWTITGADASVRQQVGGTTFDLARIQQDYTVAVTFKQDFPAPTVTAINGATTLTRERTGQVAVTLTGTGFRPGAVVRLTQAGAPSITLAVVAVSGDGTTLTGTLNLTRNALGAWTLVVMNDDGQSATLANAVTLTNARPHVTAATPASGQQGSVVTVEVIGYGFAPDATMALTRAGQPDAVCSAVTVCDKTRLLATVTLPTLVVPTVAEAWTLVVTNPSEGLSSTESVLVTVGPSPAPLLTGVSPAIAQQAADGAGTATFTLTGDHFSAMPTVTLHLTGVSDTAADVLATVTEATATTLTCTLDLQGMVAGQRDVRVTNADGQTATLQRAYTVVPATLTGVTLTVNRPDPQPFGSTLLLTATATGSAPAVEYAFVAKTYNTATQSWVEYPLSNGYTTNATCLWTPPAPVNYFLTVKARAVGSVAAYQVLSPEVFFRVQEGTITKVTLTVTPENGAYRLQATKTGSAMAVEYRFVGYKRNPATGKLDYFDVRGYQTDPTANWTPTVTGDYYLGVLARTVGSAAAYQKQSSFVTLKVTSVK